ncbi:MAG: hypothetical protein ABS79_01025 [Planctomycetes bacterium SCN 63-9]|nr:MAG: hypothetical protein ABS79_01025 [Planctomycetes bacterium SCN 63-9]
MKLTRILVLGLACLAMTAGSAKAGNLGVANLFNEFIFTDSTRQNVDSWGLVAVGNNATFNNFTVASHVNSGSGYSSYSAIIGNNLTGTQLNVGGSVPTNVLYGNQKTIGAVYNNSGGTSVNGTLPSFFTDAQSYLNALSDTLKNEAINGQTVENGFGQFILTAQGSTALQVFDVNGDHLSQPSTNGFSITANDPNQTIVINVSGTNVSMTNFGISLSGVDQTHVLFNFYEATTLTLTNMGFPGSILAPHATVVGNSGQVNGTLIANSLSGTIETHSYAFSGNLPGISPVPEPSTFALVATAGLFAIVPGARRRLLK